MKKELQIENSQIEVIFETDKEKIKRNLKKVYDVINNIASNCEKRGIDTSKWFIPNEKIEKMKKNKNYNFL